MKNKKSLFWIIVFAAVIGLMPLGCGGDDGGGSGGYDFEFGVESPTAGELTLTGVSAYAGKYVYMGGANFLENVNFAMLVGCDGDPNKAVKIPAGGTVTIPVYKYLDTTTNYWYSSYSGNHYVGLWIFLGTKEIYDETWAATPKALYFGDPEDGTGYVKFTNGKATININDAYLKMWD